MIAGADVLRDQDGDADIAAGVRVEGKRVQDAEQLDLAVLVGGYVAPVHDHGVTCSDCRCRQRERGSERGDQENSQYQEHNEDGSCYRREQALA